MFRRPTSPWRNFYLVVALAGLTTSVAAQTIIDNGDGTETVVQDNGSWQVIEISSGQVVDAGQEEGSGDTPGYDDLGGADTGSAPEAAPESACHRVETLCEPESFKKNGSRYFWLNYCPSACGVDAYLRVREVIDPAWDFVSMRFGSEYSASDLNGYVYTTGAHYSDQSGGQPWSGGFFSPEKNQIHLPAPLGRRGRDLKSLLVHELTHFRLHKKTFNEKLGAGGIKYFRFINEGLAQQLEQRLFEEEPPEDGGRSKRRHNLWRLSEAFKKGFTFAPLKDMMWNIKMDVGMFYAQSWAVVAYIEATYGERQMDRLLAEMAKISKPRRTYNHLFKLIKDVFQGGLGVDPDTLRSAAEKWTKDQALAEFRD